MINYLNVIVFVVCFYDALVMLLLPSSVQFITGTDGSTARFVVNIAALFIAGNVLLHTGFKRLENRWILFLIIIMVVSHFHSPNISFESLFIPKDMAIYNYKPMFEVMLFFVMFLAITSVNLTKMSYKKLLKSFCWTATIYALYIILQKLGIDQLYAVSGNVEHLSRNPEAGGFISQPVFAAALLALCTPFVIKSKLYWMGIIIILAIILTGNRSALVSVFLSSMVMFPRTRFFGISGIIGYICLLVGGIIFRVMYPEAQYLFADTGRFQVWANLFNDFINPSFPGINVNYILTGHGIGSFPVLFPFAHKSPFYQAHNEFFGVAWGLGVSGVICLYFMIKNVFNKTIPIEISCGLVAISICALTNSVWHIPQLAFLTVLLLALAYNSTVGADYVEQR